MRVFSWAWVCLFVVGCLDGDAGLTRVQLEVALPDAIDCRPLDDVMQLRVDGLGDFPFTAESTEIIVPADEPVTLSDFPPATRTITLDTTGLESGPRAWIAAGARNVGEDDLDGSILMLPFGRSCPLADPAMRAPAGAAAVALEDGAALVIGGEGAAGRRVLLLDAGEQLATRLSTDLPTATALATATTSGPWVVIAGGAASLGGAPHDQVAFYDHRERALLSSGATLFAARRDHGATRLSDGRVLVVGGDDGAGAIASAEVIDPGAGVVTEVDDLPAARLAPEAVTLDDGSVLVLGGLAPGGGAASSETVFEFDSLTGAFLPLDPGEASVLPFEGYAAVPLPGGRVAWVGDHLPGVSFGPECDNPPECIRVIRRVPPYLGDGAFETRDVDVAGLPELTGVRGVGLADGRLLLIGRDALSAARAYLIDLGTGALEEAEASRAPTLLLALADASALELDELGASFRRELLLTSDDRTPSTFDADALAFDALGNWNVVDAIHFEALRADARVDVPTLRFRDFELDSLEVVGGAADLLLLPEGGPPIAVRVLADAVGPALCEVERLPDAPLTLVREGSRITFSAGGETQVCHLPALGYRVGVAIRADAGATVGNLKLRRL